MRKFIANILPKSCHVCVCLCSWFHVCKIDHDHDFWLHWSAWGATAAPVSYNSPFILLSSPIQSFGKPFKKISFCKILRVKRATFIVNESLDLGFFLTLVILATFQTLWRFGLLFKSRGDLIFDLVLLLVFFDPCVSMHSIHLYLHHQCPWSSLCCCVSTLYYLVMGLYNFEEHFFQSA